jgi:hypothetical protein
MHEDLLVDDIMYMLLFIFRDNCKIGHCSWLILPITHCSIKNSLEVLKVCKNKSLLPEIKFHYVN